MNRLGIQAVRLEDIWVLTASKGRAQELRERRRPLLTFAYKVDQKLLDPILEAFEAVRSEDGFITFNRRLGTALALDRGENLKEWVRLSAAIPNSQELAGRRGGPGHQPDDQPFGPFGAGNSRALWIRRHQDD